MHFAVDALAAAGIASPTRAHHWTVGGGNVGTHYYSGIGIPFHFFGYSPAGAARDIQGALNTPYIVNTDDGIQTLIREEIPWWMRQHLIGGRLLQSSRVRVIEPEQSRCR